MSPIPGTPDPDADLLDAARAGDRDALDALLARHQETLYALCRRITGDPTDALDALQEAMIAIVRGLPRFDGRSKVSTWMHRVTTNRCLDEVRRRSRRSTDRLPDDTTTGGPPDRERPVDDRVADRTDVDAALAALAPEFRAPVVLRDLLGHDYAEIATLLDLPPGTVRSRIARGRAALARHLAGNQDTDPRRPIPEP
ncbi:MAG: sigma-70 family RNA polymerase sigma factor [Acidimicrobiales bacterium]|nr:sigma-70 family RNA polymerase sigma factor [Acidimicrobiales bacterium]